ncbi:MULTISPECIES: hypothetical protein [Pseudonocardia]|uniref:Secreted protein n=1 Tax=Pseudonocardia oroxyli TaxID=366584 RepID=A0A1G7IDK6_PSEOR|nr:MULTISPECIES: hypothetical protein [Pseudonocardia]MCF7549197.1 hypothetical protein [Pseudonocardia sp. WMMC193]SDF10604.1 hypothetical protein SAMN05216377_103269 [Pseudonocardia oroxyli]
MKRLFWVGVGAAAGAYVMRRITETKQQLTPQGIGANLADGLRELGAGLGAFGAEVRAGMQDREQELTALVEKRTGGHVPTYGEALSEDPPANDATQPIRRR